MISAGTRVRYSAEGLRVLGASGLIGSPKVTPERRGTVVKRLTPSVVEVLWDDRGSKQHLHVSYLDRATSSAASPAESAATSSPAAVLEPGNAPSTPEEV